MQNDGHLGQMRPAGGILCLAHLGSSQSRHTNHFIPKDSSSSYLDHSNSMDLSVSTTTMKGLLPPAPASTPKQVMTFLHQLAEDGKSIGRFSSFSTAVYDTAWLSMVYKPHGDQNELLYPSSLTHLYSSQQKDGTWSSHISAIDGILNTLAALLALLTRRARTSPAEDIENHLVQRIESARSGLQNLLQDWDVDKAAHVGFEILVPSLLRQLEQHDVHFKFAGRRRLMELHAIKMEKFRPELLYSMPKTTLLHSLEAFVGLIDFDRVSHHCSEEVGMFGSPAATAAYLACASAWDTRAESYLHMVVSASAETGAVPCAYPTSIFEISWALSTFLQSRAVSEQDLDAIGTRALRLFLAKTLEQRNGLVGFAPGVLEDADDTARTLMALQSLGEVVDPWRMIDKFEADNHFRTYELEGNSSFSANCNVLLALLGSISPNQYLSQITKALSFLLGVWEAGEISDKWNTAPQYSRLLLCQALVGTLAQYSSENLKELSESTMLQRIPLAICQILSQTLSEQQQDGSWAGSAEITAYSVLTVLQLQSLPWSAPLEEHLLLCLARGRGFIVEQSGVSSEGEHLWIEKTSYKSHLLETIYCVSAIHGLPNQWKWNPDISVCFSLSDSCKKMRSMLLSLPLIKQSPSISIDLALIEAEHFSSRLKAARTTIFERDEIPMTKDHYIIFIAMIWTVCNQISGHVISSKMLWEMMLLSLLNYQIDEYMESVVARLENVRLSALASSIQVLCNLDHVPMPSPELGPTLVLEAHESINGEKRRRSKQTDGDARVCNDQEASTVETFSKFIQHILQHPVVAQSPQRSKIELSMALFDFLIAHLKHNEDNAILREAGHAGAQGQNYFKWVRGTASNDTSCPFSFSFFACLISNPGDYCLHGSAKFEYYVASLCQHLATMCRQYNDYGSAERDHEESNLNSLDFALFKPDLPRSNGLADNIPGASEIGSGASGAKEDLMAIAEFERSCMLLAMDRLSEVTDSSIVDKIRLFVNVTDMFGQVYVRKDIASRVRKV